MNPRKWWILLTTVPVWIGGLRPDQSRVTLVDRAPNPDIQVLRNVRANDEGVVTARIPKAYRGRTLDLLIRDLWFKFQATEVTVESYGLYRAVRLERDYSYLPGGKAIVEDPPDDATAFKPDDAHERASATILVLARSRVNRVPVYLFNITVALLTSYLIAIITTQWIGLIALPAVSLFARSFMGPYLDGRKRMTPIVWLTGAAVVVGLGASIVYLHVARGVDIPLGG